MLPKATVSIFALQQYTKYPMKNLSICGFSPGTVKICICAKQSGYSKLSFGVNDSVNGCLSLYVSPG